MKEVPLTLAAASVSTSKAWESWWKSSATHNDKKARGENKMKLGSDNGILKKPRSAHDRPPVSRKCIHNRLDTPSHGVNWDHCSRQAMCVYTHTTDTQDSPPPQTPRVLKGLTCSGVIWIFVWVTGECFLPVCLLHLEESENIVTLPAGQQECLPKTCGDQSIPCHRRA